MVVGVYRVFHLLFVCSLLTIAQPRVHAQNLLSGAGWDLFTLHPGDAVFTEHPDQQHITSQARLHVSIKKSSAPYYRTELSTVLHQAVSDRLLLTFTARSSTKNPMRAVIEENVSPWNSIAEASPTLTPDWKQYTISGTAPAYGPDGLGVRFQFGMQPGEIEIRDVVLTALGPDPEVAKARDAVKDASIEDRIKKYRMGALEIKVLNPDGTPAAGVSVHVSQQRHEFLFGCNLFGLNTGIDSAAQREYQRRYAALFNYATLPFYWGDFQGDREHPKYDRNDSMAAWCVEHGIKAKGHPLVWHEVYPSWAPATAEETIPLLHARIDDLISRYRNTISFWDVVNEANASAGMTNGESAWIKRDGPATVVQTALQWSRDAVRRSNSGAKLIYNDYIVNETNVSLLRELQKRSALSDVIGLQSHMHDGVWPIETVWLTAQRFSQFGLPIHFTETTIVSGPRPAGNRNGSGPPWTTTPEGEVAQADYVEKFYTVLFSHPSVHAITWWDFSDMGAWQDAPAGFLRKDMTPKPVYDRLLNLIHKKWWTDAETKTGANGIAKVRGFYGDYKITVKSGSRTADVQFHLSYNSKDNLVRARLQ